MILRRFHLVVLLTLLACGPIRSFCQVDTAPWCPPGAMWFYEESTQTTIVWTRYSYLKDTIVGAEQYKVILEASSANIWGNEGRLPYDTIDRHLLLSRGDSIFVLETDTHILLYDFGAAPGDRMRIQALSGDTSSCYPLIRSDTLVVSDTLPFTSGSYSGMLLDVFSSNLNWTAGDIVRNIGSRVSFFPYTPFESCVQDGFYDGLLMCYYDSLRGWIRFPESSRECPVYTQVTESPRQIGLIESLGPNPCLQGEVTVRLSPSVESWKLFDNQGRVICTGDSLPSEIILNLPSSGLYVFMARSERGQMSIERIISHER